MTIEGLSKQKKVNRLLPVRSIENARQHRAFPLVVTKLFEENRTAPETHEYHRRNREPSAIVTPRTDDEKSAPIMNEAEMTGHQEGELMTINDRKESKEAQMNRQKEVEFNDRNRETEIGRTRFD